VTPRPHVLIVDDNQAELEGLDAIVRDEGFDTFRAETLAEARQELRAHAIDLLLCDFVLPDGRGTELVDEVTAGNDDISALLVTGSYAAPELVGRRILRKPVEIDELLTVLETTREHGHHDRNGDQSGVRASGSVKPRRDTP
jgi:DNA-binding NtrC family response regulator